MNFSSSKLTSNFSGSKTAGFTLLELLLVVAIFAVIFAAIAACGWGVAFAFSVKVLVPWLGIPAAWTHLGALIASICLTGVGTIVVLLVLVIVFLLVGGIVKACRGSRR